MGFLKRLFKRSDPLDKPCQCGRPAQVHVAPERESDPHLGEVYCPTCLEPLMKEALAGKTMRCVVMQPYDAPCFVPYSLAELAELTHWSPRLRELLSSAGRSCAECGAETSGLVSIATDQAQSLGAMQNNRHWFDGRDGVALCAGCLTGRLVRTIRERDLRFLEFVLPGIEPSAWLPWAY